MLLVSQQCLSCILADGYCLRLLIPCVLVVLLWRYRDLGVSGPGLEQVHVCAILLGSALAADARLSLDVSSTGMVQCGQVCLIVCQAVPYFPVWLCEVRPTVPVYACQQ